MKCPFCDYTGVAVICPICWDRMGKSIPTHKEKRKIKNHVPEKAIEVNEKLEAKAIEAKHHPLYPPSSMQRRASCPASARLEKGQPDTQSDDASEGTMLHGIVADCLKKRAAECTETGLTQEQKEAVDKCLEYVFALLAEKPDAELHVEKRVQITDEIFGSEITFGSCDVIIVCKDSAHVIDWKFGRGDVPEAVDNWQGGAYAVAVAQTFKVPSVTVHIFQPRIFNEISTHTFTDTSAILENIEGVIWSCEQPDAPAVCGEWCQYCKGKIICPAMMTALTKMENTRVELNIEHIHDIADPNVICELYRRAEIVEDLIKSIKHRAKEFALKNGRCGTLVLVPGAKRRKVENVTGAYQSVKSLVAAEEFLECCTISLPTLEDVYCRKNPGMKKGEAKADLTAKLGELIEIKQGDVSLKWEK